MKIYFGLQSRDTLGKDPNSSFVYKVRGDTVCIKCNGCIEFDEKNKNYICLPYDKQIDTWEAEDSSVPCSKYTPRTFKSLIK